MGRFKPHVISQIFANCEERPDGCLIWKGEYDDFGNPVFPTKRWKEHHLMRQDVIIFEAAYGTEVVDEEYLVHTCHQRGCLEPTHMKYLTDAEERADWDRQVRARAKQFLAQDKSLQEVMRLTGLSEARLRVIRSELARLRVVPAEEKVRAMFDGRSE